MSRLCGHCPRLRNPSIYIRTYTVQTSEPIPTNRARVDTQFRARFLFIGETNLFETHDTSENAVELDWIMIDAAVSAEFVGEKVFVSVRPEDISLGRTIDNSISTKLEGVVEIARYRGSYVTSEIHVGEKLLINTSGPSRGERLDSGDHVVLGWKKEDAVILPATSEG